ncbi:TRAP transporter large permease [Cohaesibacter celericrescens]|uniref:Tripartite transporter n=1 Tax=Cohaesibacter celericrescens TaxID=2067669 RepID=A0A2N5XLD5_9HYPH|nr:TRAP transporter large permease subunit [Cohaesibacter celericrescens]PLW75275.1 tripartite transporter [Cohaesibacter celericrescens]
MEALAHSLDLAMFGAACVVLMLGFPVAFSLAGVALAFALIGWLVGVFDMSFLSALPQRIFGTMTNETLLAVPLFVFMGVMLERSKVAEELLDTMGRMLGSVHGGLGIAVSIVGALLAASTGIVGATVVTMGLLSLPTMLKRGYSPELACGSIAAAGTLGQIIPPSIVLVILGDQLSNAYQKAQLEMGIFSPETVSVGDLFAGALLPGLMLVGFYIIYQVFIAIIRPSSAPSIPKAENPGVTAREVIHALLPPIFLILSVLGSILGGIATPTEAAAVGAVGSILLAGYRLDENHSWPIFLAAIALIVMLILTANVDLRVARNDISQADMIATVGAAVCALLLAFGILSALYRIYRKKVLVPVMEGTTQVTSMVFIILIGASLFSLVFRGLGGEEMIQETLKDIPGGAVGAMIAVMLLMFFLGFFLDFLEIVFVVVPMVAPVLLQLEMPNGDPMSPVWLGIMMAVNLQTSFLTPPFGFALFYLRGVAPPSVRTIQIYKGIIPFVMIQILALVLLWHLPSLATWLPHVIYG